MSVLVIAEHDNTQLKPATLNTIAAANAIGGEIHLIVLGHSCQTAAEEAAAIEGIDKVLLANDAAYEYLLAERTGNFFM